MSLLSTGLGTALGGGIGGLIGNQWNNLTKQPSANVQPINTSNPLTAGQVSIPNDLSNTFSTIGTGAYNNIGNNYNNAEKSAASDAEARGLSGPGQYGIQRLGTQEGLDIGNLASGLGGAEGNAAYENQLGQRNYNEQSQLANEIGTAMQPSMLEQIFQGIGGGANAAAQLYPLMSMMAPPPSAPSGFSMGNMPFPQGQPEEEMPLSYPGYINNPYLNGGY